MSLLQDLVYALRMQINDSFGSVGFNIASHYQAVCGAILVLAVYSVYRQCR